MKKLGILVSAGALAVALAGCGSALPPVVEEEQVMNDLPEQLTTVTIDGEARSCVPSSLVITERETDLHRQTDDMTCQVTLTGEGVRLDYSCQLNYTYTQNGGWGLEKYQLEGEPVLTLTDEGCFQSFAQANALRLQEDYGYQLVELTEQDWDLAGQSYQQEFQYTDQTGYLTTQGLVEVAGALTALEQPLHYQWQSQVTAGESQQWAGLGGTAWHVLTQLESGQAELAFRIDQQGEEFSLEGIARIQSGKKVRETSFSASALEWTADEYGGIRFTFVTQEGSQWECCLTGERNWITQEGLYLGDLEEVELSEGEALEDVMELEPSKDGLEIASQFWKWMKNLFGQGE